jgi:hypothetical protein
MKHVYGVGFGCAARCLKLPKRFVYMLRNLFNQTGVLCIPYFVDSLMDYTQFLVARHGTSLSAELAQFDIVS